MLDLLLFNIHLIRGKYIYIIYSLFIHYLLIKVNIWAKSILLYFYRLLAPAGLIIQGQAQQAQQAKPAAADPFSSLNLGFKPGGAAVPSKPSGPTV